MVSKHDGMKVGHNGIFLIFPQPFMQRLAVAASHTAQYPTVLNNFSTLSTAVWQIIAVVQAFNCPVPA